MPNARLDFSTPPSNEEGDSKDALDALFTLQRQLVKHGGLRFHLFNFAVLMYLKKSACRFKDRLKKLLTEEGDMVAALESAPEHTTQAVARRKGARDRNFKKTQSDLRMAFIADIYGQVA